MYPKRGKSTPWVWKNKIQFIPVSPEDFKNTLPRSHNNAVMFEGTGTSEVSRTWIWNWNGLLCPKSEHRAIHKNHNAARNQYGKKRTGMPEVSKVMKNLELKWLSCPKNERRTIHKNHNAMGTSMSRKRGRPRTIWKKHIGQKSSFGGIDWDVVQRLPQDSSAWWQWTAKDGF